MGFSGFLNGQVVKQTFFKYLSIASVIFNRIWWVTSQQLSNENNSYQTIQSVVICSMFWEGFSHNCSFYQSCFFITDKSSELFWRFRLFLFLSVYLFLFLPMKQWAGQNCAPNKFCFKFFLSSANCCCCCSSKIPVKSIEWVLAQMKQKTNERTKWFYIFTPIQWFSTCGLQWECITYHICERSRPLSLKKQARELEESFEFRSLNYYYILVHICLLDLK